MQDIMYAGEQPARIILSLKQKDMTPGEVGVFKENWEDGKVKLTKNLTAVVVNGHVIKHTNGQIGKTLDIKWNKSNQRFETLEEDWAPAKERPDPDAERLLQERKTIVGNTPTGNDNYSGGYSKSQSTRDSQRKKRK
jgi:hypothetical protein